MTSSSFDVRPNAPAPVEPAPHAATFRSKKHSMLTPFPLPAHSPLSRAQEADPRDDPSDQQRRRGDRVQGEDHGAEEVLREAQHRVRR